VSSVSARIDALIDDISKGDVADFDASSYRSLLVAAASDASSASFTAEQSVALIKLFTTYHTVRNLILAHQQQSEEVSSLQAAVALWETEQSEDLTRAWSILQQPRVQTMEDRQMTSAVSSLSANTAGTATPMTAPPAPPPPLAAYSGIRLLALELAQRLKNASHLQSAFDRLLAVPPAERSEEEVLASFMTAPILGRWRETRILGEQLIAMKGQQAMDDFHDAALQEAVYPDFQLLFDKSRQWQQSDANKRALPQQLLWMKFDVTNILVKHELVQRRHNQHKQHKQHTLHTAAADNPHS
jgi:hypothetical protein